MESNWKGSGFRKNRDFRIFSGSMSTQICPFEIRIS